MTQDNESPTSEFDWRMTSFEGARREQLRRWARLPLEEILLAIEEMQDIAHMTTGLRSVAQWKKHDLSLPFL